MNRPPNLPEDAEVTRRRLLWHAALRKAQAAFAELKYAERAYIEAAGRVGRARAVCVGVGEHKVAASA